MTMRRFRWLVICCACVLGGQASARVPNALPPAVARVLGTVGLAQSSLSFAVLDPVTGELLAGLNTDTPRSPASTVKVVTTFAALDLLGPSYVWHTRAMTDGPVKAGVLDGDLILKGGGDPYMTLERWWSFAHALRDKGLKSIHGDILIDDTAFALPAEDPGAFDGRPNRSYNVLPAALMVNFQSVEFRLVPNPELHRVDVVATPSPVNLTIDNRIAFTGGLCRGAADRVDFEVASARWDRVVFTGALAEGCAERSISRVLLQPADYAFGTFVALWRELGGDFSGSLRVAPAPVSAKPLLDFESLTLAEIVRLTNKYSSNLMARHLLLAIGQARFGLPATPEKGAAALADWSHDRALGLDDIAIDNGSGLSRATHISALQMARVLDAAYRSPYAPEFLASLPMAGIDGTLRARMRDSRPGSVRLKTGHIDGVSGVAGYVATPAGRNLILVSLVNDPRADLGKAEPVHAALVDWIESSL
jgi:D-alanyl-D-alanine carboxypeptidase/D-alanyl-D-alanine-endopeptidase (penicillin-binding protein 4)